ncbi:MAG: class II glutamine amidotransferase [Candidatus Bathyarchaeia archaeon]
MHKLFGFSYNKPVGVSFSWLGVGLIGIVGASPSIRICLVKEPNPSINSAMASYLRSANLIRGKVVISHVRWASKGEVAYRNTHPFVREPFDMVFAPTGRCNHQQQHTTKNNLVTLLKK